MTADMASSFASPKAFSVSLTIARSACSAAPSARQGNTLQQRTRLVDTPHGEQRKARRAQRRHTSRKASPSPRASSAAVVWPSIQRKGRGRAATSAGARAPSCASDRRITGG